MNNNWCLFLVCLLLQLITLTTVKAQAPDFLWAQKANDRNGSQSLLYDAPVATDDKGNCYVTGFFVNEITFGNTTLTSAGSSDIFLAKFNSLGVLQWAISIGGPDSDYGHGIAADAAGNIYLTGSYRSAITLGNTTLTGNNDFFVAKFDTSGHFQWAQTTGGTSGRVVSYDIAVDGVGNLYVTGVLNGQTNFGASTLTSNGVFDLFVAKFNSSGNVQWVQKAGGIANDLAVGEQIAVDKTGNVVVTGYFLGTANFGNTSVISKGSIDAFIAKYDASGSLQWVKQAGGPGDDWGTGIGVDAAENIYISGLFRGTTIALDNTTILNKGEGEIFVAKYNPAGTLEWASSAGGIEDDGSADLAVSGSGEVYIAGLFKGNATFGNVSLTGVGLNSNVFVAGLNTNGTFQWAQKAGGPSDASGSNIAIDTAGNCFVTGIFSDSATFSNHVLSAVNGAMFIAKIEASRNNETAFSINGELKIFPNPNSGLFNIEIGSLSNERVILLAYDLRGKQVLRKEVMPINGRVTEKLQLPNQNSIYFLKVMSEDQVLTKKIIVN